MELLFFVSFIFGNKDNYRGYFTDNFLENG